MAGINGITKAESRWYLERIRIAIDFAGTILSKVFFDVCWGPSFDRIWAELYRNAEEGDASEKRKRKFSVVKRSSFLEKCPTEIVKNVFAKIDSRIPGLLSEQGFSKALDRLDRILDNIEDAVFVEAACETLSLIPSEEKGKVAKELIASFDHSGVAKAILFAKDPAPNGAAVIDILASRYTIRKEVCENKLHGFIRLRNRYLGHTEMGLIITADDVLSVLDELRSLVRLFASAPSEDVCRNVSGCLGGFSGIEQKVLSVKQNKATATAAKTQTPQNKSASTATKAQPQQNNGTVQRKDVSISPISEITKDTLRIVKATSKEERTAALKKICCWGISAFLVGIVYFKIFGVAPAGIIVWNILLFASLCFFLFFPFFRYVCEKTEIESVKKKPKKAIRNTTTGLAGVFLVLILLTFALGGIPNLSAKASLKPVNPFKEVTVDVTGAEPYAYVEVINNSENEFLRQIAYEVAPNGTLKNGDVVKISAVYDKTAAAEAGVRIRKDSMTYKVEGAGTAIHSFNEIDQVAWERMLSQALDILETNLSTRSVNSFEDDLVGDVLSSWATVAWDLPELDRVYFLDRKSGNVNEGVSVNKCCLVFRSFTKTTSYGYELYPYNGYAYYSVFYDNLSSDENGATSVEMPMATLGRQAMPSIEKNYIGYISPLKETFAVEEIMVDDLLSMGYSVVIE